MRTRVTTLSAAVATTLAGALTTSLVVLAGSAGAATTSADAVGAATTHATTATGQGHTKKKSHRALARQDWKAGAAVAATEADSWTAARGQLAHYGDRYLHEQDDLTALINIPLTDTTPKQQARAARATRELNGFFRTPGLYGVKAGKTTKFARADWIKSSKVNAAEGNFWHAAAVDELDSYGKRYAAERAELTSLEAVPLTNTTAKQRATARRDVRALDGFFDTPGLNY